MYEYHVGDIVRIRQWDDMEEEFGLTDTRNIKCNFKFTREMKELCGHEVIIKKIHKSGRVFFEEDPANSINLYERIFRDHPYSYHTDMIEPVYIPDINDDDIFGVICDGDE